jgi:hypothetical protein
MTTRIYQNCEQIPSSEPKVAGSSALIKQELTRILAARREQGREVSPHAARSRLSSVHRVREELSVTWRLKFRPGLCMPAGPRRDKRGLDPNGPSVGEDFRGPFVGQDAVNRLLRHVSTVPLNAALFCYLI